MKLVHVTISSKLRRRLDTLIDEGLFNNYSEIVREGLFELRNKYIDKSR